VITADAPGKLVLIGEYAVLAGAPGIAVAVDARAGASLSPAGSSCLVIPEAGARYPFSLAPDGSPRWGPPHPGAFGRPLEAVLVTLRACGLLEPGYRLPPLEVLLTSAAFHDTDAHGARHKLGLGSSAAVTVALLGALLRMAGRGSLPVADVLALACDAHRRLQGGAGSGIDVATAIVGGVAGVEYPEPGGTPTVLALRWPDHLHCLAIWTGRSASTPDMLGRLRIFQAASPTASAGHLGRLGAASTEALAAWRAGDAAAVLAAVATFATALRALDAAASIGIWAGGHAELATLAAGHGVCYKPSGAGGGDYGLALADDPGLLATLRGAAEAAGYRCLERQLAVPGLRVEGTFATA
jgi:phosphomevalonate kinase